MGILYSGILSDFKGTVGTVVGSRTKNGTSFIKAKTNKPRANASEAQKSQQVKFNAIVTMMRKLNPILKVGFMERTAKTKMSPFNYGCQKALTNSVSESDGVAMIDYGTLLLSEGLLSMLKTTTASLDGDNVAFSWDDTIYKPEIEAPDDVVYLTAYNSMNGEWSYSKEAKRSDKHANLLLPYGVAGDEVYLYLFMQSAMNPANVSTSQCVASVVML